MNSTVELALRDALKALYRFIEAENQRRQERHDHNERFVARNGGQLN